MVQQKGNRYMYRVMCRRNLVQVQVRRQRVVCETGCVVVEFGQTGKGKKAGGLEKYRQFICGR